MSERTSASLAEMVAEAHRDPELKARWERLALARAVGDAVLRYRVEHKLSQRKMAERLGMKASQVGRLELAEHNPSLETLERLATGLGLRFVVDVAPGRSGGHLVLPPGLRVVQDVETTGGGRVVVAAG